MSQLGRYRVVRRIGQGGMAEVHEGVFEGSAGFRRRVAIKRLLPELSADVACARMFMDEAHIASQLHHANLVAVYDFGESEQGPYQILEFVDGSDLDQLLRWAVERGTPPPVGVALHIAREVAHGLHAAHEARDERGEWLAVVHRDVSPSNVLVSRDGQVKLSDFGIAYARARLSRTEGAVVKGKLAYMAPEQATRGVVDRRTDVFALGCLLHTMLLGDSPIADLAELTQLALGEELRLAARLDPALREILARALASRPEQRFANAAELAARLAGELPRLLSGDPAQALSAWVRGLTDEPAGRAEAPPALFDAMLALPAEWAERAGSAAFTVHDEPAAEHAAVPAARPRTRMLALTLAACTTLFVGTWFVWHAGGPPPEPAATAVKPPRTAFEPSAASAPGNAANALSEPAQAPSTASAPAVAGASRARPRKAQPTRTSAPPEVGTGTLIVGGPGAQRARLRVDGRDAGFAPKRIDLPLGEHLVALTAPSGEVISRRVLIAAEHTDSAPLRVMVP